jgi:cephalosporin-C deacetylase-like acetyl esterase
MSDGDGNGRPDGFDPFWDAIDEELARYPAAPELEAVPLRSTAFSTTHEVRLTSIGPYRIFGWYSVPHGDGPFPGLLHLPAYGSVVTPAPYDDRERYAVFSLAYRGQRRADSPFAAAYPGLLTYGIADPTTYVYRGIAADALRAAEFVLSRPEVDAIRVGVTGNDLAVVVAARRPGFATLQINDWLFYRLMEARRRTSAYPWEEVNDYLRANPDSQPLLAATLALFDPIHHAPRVECPAVVKLGAAGGLTGEEWLTPVMQSFGGPVTRYPLTNEGGTDRDWLDNWLARHLGAEPKSRVWQVVSR